MGKTENDSLVLVRVDMMLDSLDRLAQTENSAVRFYAELLSQLKLCLAAVDCCILVCVQPGRWNSLIATSPRFGVQAVEQLTRFAMQNHATLPAWWHVEEASSKWIGLGLQGGRWTAGGIVALLPTADPTGNTAELGPANTTAMHELLEAFAEIANRFQWKHGFLQVDPQSIEVRSVAASILACKTATEADKVLADGARCLIDADRVTLVRLGSRMRDYQTLAISGHPTVDLQSSFVRSLHRHLFATGSDHKSFDRLAEWATEVGSAVAVSYPIAGTSLLVMEWFDEGRYVHNASRIESAIPWLTVAWQSHSRPNTKGLQTLLLKLVVLSICVACSIIFFASATELTIHSQGTLQPSEQRFVFAPAEGYVDKIHVADGQLVRIGEIIATMESPQLQLQINQVASEIGIVDQKRNGLNITLNQLEPADDPSNVTGSRLAGEIQELESRRQSLLEQKELLDRENERLKLRSPIDGTLMAWEVERHLENRPVRRGDLLFRVASLEEQWRIESTVADWESGYVVDVQRAQRLENKPLSVEFVLATASELRGVARIDQIGNTMRDVNGSPQLDLVVIPNTRIENPRLGTSATVSIPCGRFPRWFVWTRSILDAVRRRFWF
jgi:multidrug efflux pump subunit AcrA (membrane-fusion protein)